MPYINTGLLSLNRDQYKQLVFLLLLCFSVVKPLLNCFNVPTDLFPLVLFMKILLNYIIGGYLRIIEINNKIAIIIFGFLSFTITINFEYLFDKFACQYQQVYWLVFQEQFCLQINSIFPIISGIGLIYLVKDFNIHNKYINFISSSTFGIYLIHANRNIAPYIYNAWFKIEDYNQDYFFIKYFLKAFIIFFISLLIDIFRRFTFELIVQRILNFFIN